MSGETVVLDARGLTKRYDGRTVVDAVSFSVARGECVALLGPNGAGKTTTIRMRAQIVGRLADVHRVPHVAFRESHLDVLVAARRRPSPASGEGAR
jgi:ABC-type lipopolysaccharide export system ATPase subunit